MTTVIITTTGSSTWTVPASVTSIQAECIGAGGGGSSQNGSDSSGGGGGGAYSKTNSLTVTPGATVYLFVGAAGAHDTAGGDTWLNISASSAPASTANGCLAKGGGGATTRTGAAGGASASGVGNTKFSGGTGGNGILNGDGGGGGGGGAGPTGAGKNGGSSVTNGGGGGGGGSNGGSSTAGSNGNGTTGNGGAGGNGTGGSGGGTAGTSSSHTGGTGSSGGGGGGGYSAAVNDGHGGPGGMDTAFDATHGAGGGGGGGGWVTSASGFNGGNGAAGSNYGGGGGGGGWGPTTNGSGGSGGQGIIVITYSTGGATTVATQNDDAFASSRQKVYAPFGFQDFEFAPQPVTAPPFGGQFGQWVDGAKRRTPPSWFADFEFKATAPTAPPNGGTFGVWVDGAKKRMPPSWFVDFEVVPGTPVAAPKGGVFSQWWAPPSKAKYALDRSWYGPVRAVAVTTPNGVFTRWTETPRKTSRPEGFTSFSRTSAPAVSVPVCFSEWPPAHKVLHAPVEFSLFRHDPGFWAIIEPDSVRKPRHKVKNKSRSDYSLYNHPVFDVIHDEYKDGVELTDDERDDIRIGVIDEILAELGVPQDVREQIADVVDKSDADEIKIEVHTPDDAGEVDQILKELAFRQRAAQDKVDISTAFLGIVAAAKQPSALTIDDIIGDNYGEKFTANVEDVVDIEQLTSKKTEKDDVTSAIEAFVFGAT